MGAYVTRKDPETGNNREYYKADDGKLYNDYDSAAQANMNPLARAQRFLATQVDNAKAVNMAADEAAPAIASGLMGQGPRVDTEMSDGMQRAILDAYQRAKNDGSKNVEYKHFDATPEGKAARLTVGQMNFEDFETNDDGQVVGFKQVYDTDKTPEQALGEFNLMDPRTYYKPAEALLAQSQTGGVTTHDIQIGEQNQPATAPVNVPAPSPVTAATAPAYAVQSGDTLSAIAKAKGLSVARLAQLNNISNPNLINVGQKLILQ